MEPKAETVMRYQVEILPEQRHCALEASVVDTTKPMRNVSGEPVMHDGRPIYDPVCDCYDLAYAERICAALNAMSTVDNNPLTVDK